MAAYGNGAAKLEAVPQDCVAAAAAGRGEEASGGGG